MAHALAAQPRPAATPDPVQLAMTYLKAVGYSVERADPSRNFVDWCRCVYKSHFPVHERTARTRLEKVYRTEYTSFPMRAKATAMGEESGLAGGYAVPPDFTFKLMETFVEESFVYPRATVIPMASKETTCPKVNAETVSGTLGVSNLLGGIQFKWGSSPTPQETEPQFRALSLEAWDLIGYAVMSNQFLEDIGPAGEDYLLKLFGRAAAWYAEYAFLNGDGAAQLMPLGVIKAPGTLVATRAGAGTIVIADIANMTTALLPSCWKTAIWGVSPSALAKVQQISSYYINVELGGMHKAAPQACGMLSTKPLFLTESLPMLGTKGDIVLFDPRMYVIGERQQVLIDLSPHSHFQTNQTDARIWLRMDGKPLLSSTVTLADNSTKAAAAIILSN